MTNLFTQLQAEQERQQKQLKKSSSSLVSKKQQEKIKTVKVKTSKRANEQIHTRSNEQTSEGSKVGLSKNVFEQTSEGSKAHDYRTIHRLNADLFLDQLEFIEDQTKNRRRVTGKSVSKGEVLREIVDFYINNKN